MPELFRVQLRQLAASRDLGTGLGAANAQFEVAWEPRLRPMLLVLKTEDVKIRDDLGQTVPPRVAEAEMSVVLRPENPAMDDMVFDPADVEIYGKVVSLLRRF